MLENVIRKIAIQETRNLFSYSIVIVDNDVLGTAADLVIRLRRELDIDIQYAISVGNVIPVARNKAVLLAAGNYISIIDDDEFPPPQWLLTMYRSIQTFDVDGALGPVHPFFEQAPPDWLVRGRFCERPSQRTGTLLKWNQTRTGNCLIRKEVFLKNNLMFNENFKTGGSDQDFFKRAIEAGYRFVAIEEAPVYEIVPPERWTKSYYLKRALVNGFNAHKYTNNQGSKLLYRIIMPIKSFGALVTYILFMPLIALLGTHMIMKYAEKSAHHLSRLAATIGIELIKERNF